MKYKKHAAIGLFALPVLSGSALTLEVQRFDNGQPLPLGYQEAVDPDFESIIDQEQVIKLSEPPFVDYMIPNNQGSSGITAQKQGGQYITGTNAEDPGGGFLGANNWPDPDRWHPVFEWTDGVPLPFASDYYGVSHSGWSADQESNLITRIDLASTEELTVYHWFNDGWDYNNHYLDGHILTVTQYNADGAEVDSTSVTLPSGGAEDFFGNWRQFYSSIITATATGSGDYLILQNRGANIGYKGTAVAILEASGTDPWYGFEVSEAGDANTESWLGWVNVINDPWIWSYSLDKFIYVPDNSGWIYVMN